MAKRVVDAVNETEKSNVPPELYLEHARAIQLAERGLDEAKAILKDAKKRAKGAGIDVKAMEWAHKLLDRDPDERALMLKNARKYAEWEGRPIGFQATLFGDKLDIEQPTQEAVARRTLAEVEDDGYQAGLQDAAAADCPHIQGSEFAAEWTRGWSKARDFMKRRSPDDTGDTMPPQRGRGRSANGAARTVN